MRILEEALTFDDVLLVPGVLGGPASRRRRSARSSRAQSRLNLPILSAAMDTVTEARLAITIAQEGGIGIIHKNMTIAGPGARSGAGQEVRKRRDPRSDHRRARARPSARCIDLTRAKNISGVPVVAATARRSASSRIATCVSRRKLDAPCLEVDDAARATRDRARECAEGRGARSCCTSTASRRCWSSTAPASSRA